MFMIIPFCFNPGLSEIHAPGWSKEVLVIDHAHKSSLLVGQLKK